MEPIEYVSLKSKELLVTQVGSWRSLHQKAGTVIAVAALFAPLFLFLVEKAENWVRITASILIIPLIAGIILLLITLRARKLKQGYDETNFEELMNYSDIEDVFAFEIAYNKYSIEENDKILKRQNRKYNWGIGIIIISIILSIALLIVDTTLSKKELDTNNKISNTMSDTEKNKPKTQPIKEKTPIKTLPKVNPQKVKELNEGLDPKVETRKKKG